MPLDPKENMFFYVKITEKLIESPILEQLFLLEIAYQKTQ